MPTQRKHYITNLKRDNEVKLYRHRTHYVHDEQLYNILLNGHFADGNRNTMN